MTERNRNQLQQTATASGAALLPALPSVPLGNVGPDLRRFLEAVKERLEVREGSRGNPFEAVVTKRDLASAGLLPAVMGGRALGGMSASGGLMMRRPDGSYATLSVDEFAAHIYQSPLFQSLKRSLSDPTRFDDLPSEIKNYLLNSIADEAARRGADIRNTEFKLQTELRSLAYKVEEVTAAVSQSSAGVRQMTFALAEADRAQAGQITQVEARINDVEINPSDIMPTVYATTGALPAAGVRGKYYKVGASAPYDLYRWTGTAWILGGAGTTASLEEKLVATADRIEGSSAAYTLKLNAGGAIASIGLMASEDPTGATDSDVIVQADRFAVMMPGLSTAVPFGVDASGVYINGSLKVNAGGATLDSISGTTGIYITYDTQFFKYDATGTIINSTVTLTANLTGSLSGYVDWDAISGFTTGTPVSPLPADGTANTATINVADLTGDAASFQITFVDGATTYTDTVTLVKLRDGSDSITGILTNEAHTVPASSAGVVSDWTGAGGEFRVYRGSTELTSGVTYAIQTNPSTLTASINSSTGVFSVTAAGSWASGSSTTTLTLRATIGSTTIDKVFTLTKSLGGAAGTNGSNGTNGDAVDIVFVRSASAPATPTASAGTPTAPITWYSSVGAVPASVNPMWSSVGQKAAGASVYTWDTPVKVDGTAVAEVTIFRRSATAPATPTGGTYTFTALPSFTPPASWSASVPAGTDPVYTSRAVVSAPSGYTTAVTISGWTTPVISLQNGADGATGATGAAGTRGSLTGYGYNYYLFYSTSWADGSTGTSTQRANRVIDNMLNGTTSTALLATTTHLRIGDTVTLTDSAAPTSAITKYWSGTQWLSPGVVIDGNLLVNGTVSALALEAVDVITSTLQIASNLVTVPDRASETTSDTITVSASVFTDLISKTVAFGTVATSGCHVSVTLQLNPPGSPTAADTVVRIAISLTGGASWAYGDEWVTTHSNRTVISFAWSQANAFTGNVVFKVQARRSADTGWTCTTKVMNIMGTKR